jgi:hypothetical protein
VIDGEEVKIRIAKQPVVTDYLGKYKGQEWLLPRIARPFLEQFVKEIIPKASLKDVTGELAFTNEQLTLYVQLGEQTYKILVDWEELVNCNSPRIGIAAASQEELAEKLKGQIGVEA